MQSRLAADAGPKLANPANNKDVSPCSGDGLSPPATDEASEKGLTAALVRTVSYTHSQSSGSNWGNDRQER